MPVRRTFLPRLCVMSATVACAMAALASIAEAQGGALGRLKKRAEDEMKRRAESEADRAVDKKIDDLENAIRCTVGDDACIAKAEQSGKKVVMTDAKGQPVETKASVSAAEAVAQRPGEGAWANYDFVPGEKPLRITDFSKDVIGDFPRSLEASEGNFEVVEWKGDRWLRANGQRNVMLVPAGAPLPSRWTLEFDMMAEQGECWVYPGGDREGNPPYFNFTASHGGYLERGDGRSAGAQVPGGEERRASAYTARIMVDGRYAKAFVGETRVVNVPNFDYTRGSSVMFYCDGNADTPIFLRNVRLASGGRKLYDALAESGRVATQGIYFDVGSDRLRPESTPTLKEIGAMLTEHPELKLAIEGHTDDTGNAAANKTLSQKRAESVRQYLQTSHGVAADRLTAVGMGQEKPVAPNSTPEGRQQNRRVELVRQN